MKSKSQHVTFYLRAPVRRQESNHQNQTESTLGTCYRKSQNSRHNESRHENAAKPFRIPKSSMLSGGFSIDGMVYIHANSSVTDRERSFRVAQVKQNRCLKNMNLQGGWNHTSRDKNKCTFEKGVKHVPKTTFMFVVEWAAICLPNNTNLIKLPT